MSERLDERCEINKIAELEAELERARCIVTDHQKYLEEAQHRIEVQSTIIIGCETKINEYRAQLADTVQERDNYYEAYQLYMERALDAEKELSRYEQAVSVSYRECARLGKTWIEADFPQELIGQRVRVMVMREDNNAM